MADYRIVGTFTPKIIKSADGKEEVRFSTVEKPPTVLKSHKPRDITSSYQQYQPINIFSTVSANAGFVWGHIRLEAGQVWTDWEGQRLIIEASPNRVIYKKLGTGTKKSNGIFLQSPKGFITNVTVDTMSHQIVDKTKITKRLAEWEVHFLTGFLGASH